MLEKNRQKLQKERKKKQKEMKKMLKLMQTEASKHLIVVVPSKLAESNSVRAEAVPTNPNLEDPPVLEVWLGTLCLGLILNPG